MGKLGICFLGHWRRRPTAVPDVKPGEHRRGSATEHPHGEEDDEERGGEHHLAGVGGRVSYGQGERHGSPQTCGGHSDERRLKENPRPL